MKIGLITTHYALNYGAFLQALALQKTISGMGHDCEIIDYRPESATYGRKYLHKCSSLETLIRNIYAVFLLNSYRGFSQRRKKFDEAIIGVMRLSPRSFRSREDILQNLDSYDAFICGSDQIWNLGLMYDPVFFLDFSQEFHEAKCIAYGPSICMTELSETAKQIYVKHLQRFAALSVRESSAKEVLAHLTKRRIKVVLDPVFLWSCENWKGFSEFPHDYDIRSPYIFCYFIGSSALARRALDKLRKITGYQAVYCNIQLRDRLNSDVCIRNASPQEFVGLIQNAALIFTNSFHATAFSILFEKPMTILLNGTSKDRRIIELLKSIGSRNHTLIDPGGPDRLDLYGIQSCLGRYHPRTDRLKILINASVQYLRQSLEEPEKCQ